MIDMFSLLLTHGLMLFAAWRLIDRAEIDPPSGLAEFRDPEPVAEARPSREPAWITRDA